VGWAINGDLDDGDGRSTEIWMTAMGGKSVQSADDLLSYRIVMCDDSTVNINILSRLLTAAGYTNLIGLTDPRNVMPAVQGGECDLLLLDIEMPHLDGFQVMDLLREHLSADDFLPVLVLTGHQGEQVRDRALAEGANDFVNKPFNDIEILLRVRNLLRVRQSHRLQQHLNHELERKVVERTLELTRATESLIQRLAMAGEMRDNETAQHVVRVGRVSRILAEGCGLTTEFCAMIETTAPMHDIGKIGVPDAILLKPGKLTAEERLVMEKHAELGGRLLGDHDTPLVRMAQTIALGHHEKWDGTGYPYKLTGENNPIEARICAVSDVFDALTSERPYKKAWTVDEAVGYIHMQAGKGFDPQIVSAFVAQLDAILEIRERFSDE
jgi:putative two-component system response regulator